MPGPWEEYQSPAAIERPPWEEYAATAPSAADKPGIIERAASNFTGSLKNALTHPTFPGMPAGAEDIPAGEHFGAKLEQQRADLVKGLKDLWHHPIDTVVNYVKDKFATDPVGTSLAVAALGKGAAEEVPVPASVTRATTAVKEAAKAGGKDVAMGAAKTAGGVALAKSGPMGEIADVVAGVPIIKSGVKQMGRGIQSGYKALKDSLAETKAAEAGPEAGSEPPMAGSVPITKPEAAAPQDTVPRGTLRRKPMDKEIVLPESSKESFGTLELPKKPAGTADTAHPEGAYPIPAEERTQPGATAPKESYERAGRTVKARALARYLRLGQIPVEDAQVMTPEHWAMAAKDAGVALPSAKSVEQAIQELGKLYESKGSIQIDKAIEEGNPAKANFYVQKSLSESSPLAKNPKARAIAEKLAEALSK